MSYDCEPLDGPGARRKVRDGDHPPDGSRTLVQTMRCVCQYALIA